MTSEVLNIGKIIRLEAYQKRGKRGKTTLRVSEDAIQEEISFLKALVESHVNYAGELAIKNKRKTITSEDIIQANGVKETIKIVEED